MISTKLLIPRVNPNFIQRPSLNEKLCTGLNRKLIHISAPPGSGKTSLVSEWINWYDNAASWYSLDVLITSNAIG